MSSGKNLLSKIMNKSFNLVDRLKYRFLREKQEMSDRIENREFLGNDKYENQYFQYYSYHGIPTRRRVYYKFFSTNKFHIDIHFVDWLFHRTAFPPTPNELNQLYLEDERRMQRAIEWDKQEEAKQVEYRNKIKHLQKNEEQLLLEANDENSKEGVTIDNFKPIPWKVVAKTRADLKKYIPPEEVRQTLLDTEQGIKEEYQDYQAYLQEKGKDKDKIAEQKALMSVSSVRYEYEHIQMYGYLFQGIDSSKDTIPISEILKNKPPTYDDPYVSVHRKQILKDEEDKKKIIAEIKNNREKYPRYNEFYEKCNDIFEEYESLPK